MLMAGDMRPEIDAANVSKALLGLARQMEHEVGRKSSWIGPCVSGLYEAGGS
jgi:hypothetical protein